MKKLSFLFLTAALFLNTGCDDENAPDITLHEGCVKDYCDGQELVVCANDGSEIRRDCGTPGCNSKTATCNKSSSDKCTETKCDGNNLNICDPDTGKITVMNCGAAGCNKTENRCNKTSQDNKCKTSACDGNKLIICDTESGNTTETDCGTTGCNAEKLECNKTETDKCEATTCDGNDLQLCNPDGTVTKKECGTAGCNAEKLECNEAEHPFEMIKVPESQNNKEGAKCYVETFVPHCDGNIIVSCFGDSLFSDTGKVLYEDCGHMPGDDGTFASFICAMTLINDQNEPRCFDPNSEKPDDFCENSEINKEVSECISSSFGDSIETHTCKRYSDGKNRWYFSGMTHCSTPCSEGCEQIACDATIDADKCVDNNLMSCDPFDVWHITVCGSQKCKLDPDWDTFMCM